MSIHVTWIGEGAEPHRLIADTVRVLGREYGPPATRVSLGARPPDTYDAARRQHSSRAMLAWLAARANDIGAADDGRTGTGPAKAGHHDRHGRHRDDPSAASGVSGTGKDPSVASGVSRTGARLLAVTDVDLFIPVLTFVFGEAQLGGHVAIVSIARLRDGGVPAVLATRLATEAVHEIGHTFGLVHCASPACVMARSPGLAAVDRKTDRLCADCRVRYQQLREQPYVAAHPPHSHR